MAEDIDVYGSAPRERSPAAALPEPMWLPIESAPRDGTHVLIAFGQDHVSSGAYVANDDDPFPWKFLDQQAQGFPIFNGARDDKYGPTHWMPLPGPPLANSASGGSRARDASEENDRND